jgi:hypothetical protein
VKGDAPIDVKRVRAENFVRGVRAENSIVMRRLGGGCAVCGALLLDAVLEPSRCALRA